MKSLIARAGIVGLIATSFASQGCLVPWKKYLDCKKQNERLTAEISEKDSQIADDAVLIQTLRDQLNAKDQLIQLYEDKKKEAELLARQTKEELDRVRQEIDQRLVDIARRHKGVDLEAGGLTIKDTLLFPFASDQVSDEGKQVLQEIAQEFKGTGEFIQVDGHTDDIKVKRAETVKKFGDNWGLSAMRACAVVRLLQDSGIKGDRMIVRGFSMYRPKADARTEAARAQNRRVEIYFIPKEVAAPEAPEGAPEGN